ncbi:unnamed protein product [Meloidogyne enterolobii]|uniref:Uncharacterized protein n=1 Tax=Meloidogyne enterolobii TaxID=390850 RepID=A0ACB1AHQ6_MELEN
MFAPTINCKEFIPVPSAPMICQTHLQPMIWSLPKFSGCPKIDLDTSKAPTKQKRIIYVSNPLEYSTKAWACRKVNKIVQKYTSLTGVPVTQNLNSEIIAIRPEECRQMAYNKRCDLGNLQNETGLWHTNRKIDLTPRPWLLGSFSWKKEQIENCYAYETEVYSHFGAKTIITPAGATHDCHYSKGFCTLNDNTVVVWEPELNKMCRYKMIGAMLGHNLGNIWVSNLGEIGLSSHLERKVYDCGKNLTVSDQGPAYVITFEKRNKRDLFNVIYEGAVSSSQLAAQLTYLQANLTNSVNTAFAQAFHTFCDFLKDTQRWIEASYLSNPTNLARFIHQNNFIIAKKAGVSLLKTWPCVPLSHSEYQFHPTRINNTCFEFLPVILNTDNKEQLAFLDPSTLTISLHSKLAPCEEYQKILIQTSENIFEVDQLKGGIQSVHINKLNEAELDLGMKSFIPKLAPHAFHHLVLLNLTDLATHTFATNLVQISQLTYKIDKNEASETKTTLSDEWSAIENAIIEKAVGNYSTLWRNAVTICLIICLGDLVARLIFAYMGVRLQGPIMAIGRPLINGITKRFGSKRTRSPMKTGSTTELQDLTKTESSSPEQSTSCGIRERLIDELTQSFSNQESEINSEESTKIQIIKGNEFLDWLNEFLSNPISKKPSYKLPQNSGDLTHFLDKATHFGKEIPNFNTIIDPINKTSGDETIKWNKEQISIYKAILTQMNVLARGNANSPTHRQLRKTISSTVLTIAVILILVPNAAAAPIRTEPIQTSQDSLLLSVFVVSIIIALVIHFTTLFYTQSQPTTPITAIIKIEINDISVKALADTGATISIAPISLSHKLNTNPRTSNIEALSVSAHVMKILATATVYFKIGKITLRGPLHFVSDDQAKALNGRK